MQQRWICFQRWFTPFDSIVIKLVKCLPKIIHIAFTSGDVIRKRLDYFENLNVIPLGFDGSRNTPKCNEKFRRATEIFEKNEGGATLQPPAVRGLSFILARFNVFNAMYVLLASLNKNQHELNSHFKIFRLFAAIIRTRATPGLLRRH